VVLVVGETAGQDLDRDLLAFVAAPDVDVAHPAAAEAADHPKALEVDVVETAGLDLAVELLLLVLVDQAHPADHLPEGQLLALLGEAALLLPGAGELLVVEQPLLAGRIDQPLGIHSRGELSTGSRTIARRPAAGLPSRLTPGDGDGDGSPGGAPRRRGCSAGWW